MGCPVSKDLKGNKLKADCIDYYAEYTSRHKKVITDNKVTAEYNIKSLLGTGTFSDVYFVEEKNTKLPYAIKWVQLKNVASYEAFVAEKKALQGVKHPNIVKFKDVIVSATDAYIIMELATGGDLFEQIQANGYLKETECARVTEMLVSAIDYLHGRGITHRDLKAENVLYYTPGVNSRVVLTDFGFASLRGKDTILNTVCGTPEYFSPELVLEKKYTNKVDIWALGCLVYFMLSGRLPFTGNGISFLNEMIKNAAYTFKGEIWCSISEHAKNFINICLRKEQCERATAKELLKSTWLTNENPQSPQIKSRRLSLTKSDASQTTLFPGRNGVHGQFNRNEKKAKNFTNIEKLPPIGNCETPYISSGNNISSDNNISSGNNIVPTDRNDKAKNLHAIEEYLRKNIENARNSDKSSESSTISHHSLLSRRGLGTREASYRLKDIVLPSHMEKRITKEDLFSVQSSNASMTSSSLMSPSLANDSNIGNYGSDSPMEFHEVNNTRISEVGMNGRNCGKTLPSFTRSSQQLHYPELQTIKQNTISLFTPENLKQHNKSLDKSFTHNDKIQLDSSFSRRHSVNFRHSNYGSSRFLRSCTSHKISTINQNREKVSTWLVGPPEKELKNSGSKTGVHTLPSFRNSNSVCSKNLANSF